MKTASVLALVMISVAAPLAPFASRADERSAAAEEGSGVCFDAGLYVEGATVDYDSQVTGDGATDPRRIVSTAKKTKKFNGEPATPIVAEFYGDSGEPSGATTSYFRIVDGFVSYLGLRSKTVRQTLKPASRDPLALEKGETFKQRYVTTSLYKDGRKEKIDQKEQTKFAGFDTLKFAVGTFRACKFMSRIMERALTGNPVSVVTNRTEWVAAEGPYRGFALRTKIAASYSTGQSINQQLDVTKIRKFETK